jgi:putative phosphoserine phosphatase/1-acylglycerol-3-phosphate O-acyltransferase
MSLDQRAVLVSASLPGPKIGAFFDFDGTLIEGYSAAALYSHRLRNGELGLGEIVSTARAMAGDTLTEDEFGDLLRRGIANWVGRQASDIAELGEQLFRQSVAGSLFHDMWRLVRLHQRLGHTVVVATSATRMQIEPLARELGISEVICTELETEEGALTGQIVGRPPWGPGKAAAVKAFACDRGIDLAESFGYANGDEDEHFLGAVGHPCAVNPQPHLAAVAVDRGWPVVYLPRRSKRFDPMPSLRTAAMYGTLVGAGAAGVAVGLLTGKRRRGIDLATTLFAQVGSALGDIEIDVVGEANLWSARPAVFIINHQSSLIDLLVTTTLLRGGFTAVAKREAASIPVLGRLLTMADFAFIDRSDGVQAREALGEAADRLAEGVSIVVAPEGTRSYSPRVGQFKKGAFHLAMQAGVPIVPIVIRNAGEIMWRNAKTARPGMIEVVVHDPIPTSGWTKADLDAAVERVHGLYESTLEAWQSAGDAAEVTS